MLWDGDGMPADELDLARKSGISALAHARRGLEYQESQPLHMAEQLISDAIAWEHQTHQISEVWSEAADWLQELMVATGWQTRDGRWISQTQHWSQYGGWC